MQKGKFGICLCFYAALAFVLAFLGQTLLCGLLLGFVIVAEKSEWATKQTMQAFFLSLLVSVVSEVLDILNIFKSIPVLGAAVGAVFSAITSLVSLLVLVLVIVALTRVIKDKEANIPVLSKLANRAYGIVEKKIYTQAPVAPPPAAPGYNQPPVYGAQPQQPPVYAAPSANVPPQETEQPK